MLRTVSSGGLSPVTTLQTYPVREASLCFGMWSCSKARWLHIEGSGIRSQPRVVGGPSGMPAKRRKMQTDHFITYVIGFLKSPLCPWALSNLLSVGVWPASMPCACWPQLRIHYKLQLHGYCRQKRRFAEKPDTHFRLYHTNTSHFPLHAYCW